MHITLLVDNPDSWIIPYVKKLKKLLAKDHQVEFVVQHKDIKKGDLAFFLSCGQIVSPEVLKLNKHNLVVHESKLPQGKGWSPLSWQVLAGKNKIPITLFDAAEAVDSGEIYLQDYMQFQGDELIDELRQQQGEKTIELVLKFIKIYPGIKGIKQQGKESFYPRRTPKDSELDIEKSIKSQVNLLRVVDNERYPAFFKYRGNTYILKIQKEK